MTNRRSFIFDIFAAIDTLTNTWTMASSFCHLKTSLGSPPLCSGSSHPTEYASMPNKPRLVVIAPWGLFRTPPCQLNNSSKTELSPFSIGPHSLRTDGIRILGQTHRYTLIPLLLPRQRSQRILSRDTPPLQHTQRSSKRLVLFSSSVAPFQLSHTYSLRMFTFTLCLASHTIIFWIEMN